MDAGSSYSHPPMPSPTSHLRFDTAAPDPDPALRLPNPHASYETDEEGVEEIRNGLHRNASAPLARPSRSRKPLRSQTLPVPAHTQDPVPDEASYWDADGPPMPVAESYMPVSPPSKRVAAPAMSMPMPEPSQYPKTSFIPRMPIPTPVASTPATPSDDLYSFMPSSDTDEDHAEMPMMPVPATRITLSMPEPDLPSELPVLADDDAEHERLLAQIVALEATLTELQVSASAADADASERTRLAAKVAALEAKLAAAEARAAATDSTPRAERADTIPGAPPPATAAQPPSHPTASEDAARAAAELATLRAQLSAATSTSARADAERKQLAQRVSALQADLTSSRTGAKTDADRLAKQLAAAQAQLRGAEASAAKQAAELQAARQAAASAASKARADAAAQKAKPAPPPERPPINGGAHLGTEYTHMLLALDAVPFWHNAAASAATWILLAGFVVLPGTFSTLSTLDAPDGTVEATVVHAVRHVSLFVIAWVLCGIGAAGMLWLWYRWSRNYIWLLSHVFTPGALNGLAGVASTLASVLGAQNGVFNPSAITTLAATGGTAAVCGALAGWYSWVMLARVKRQHEEAVGKEGVGRRGEGIIRAAKEVMGARTTTVAR